MADGSSSCRRSFDVRSTFVRRSCRRYRFFRPDEVGQVLEVVLAVGLACGRFSVAKKKKLKNVFLWGKDTFFLLVEWGFRFRGVDGWVTSPNLKISIQQSICIILELYYYCSTLCCIYSITVSLSGAMGTLGLRVG
jgi:hypothetical protein